MKSSNHRFYQHKAVSSEPSKSELMLDLDDLHLFRFYGLGLRYNELERGLRETQTHSGTGDAVSLGNYGLNYPWPFPGEVTTSNAMLLQTEMRKFVEGALRVFHKRDGRYNNAAFLLVMRGSGARTPREFENYPLGKCQKSSFSSSQIMRIIKSDELQNLDLNHAAEQCFHAILSSIACMKIELAIELKAKLIDTDYANFIPVLDRLIKYYQQGVVVNEPILSSIMQCAIKAGCYKNDENQYCFDEPGYPYLAPDKIINAIDKIDDKQLKATGKIERPNEYHHPFAQLCVDERNPNTFASVKSLLPREDAYAKYMAIRRCTLELSKCHVFDTPKTNISRHDLKSAEHFRRLLCLIIASLTERECLDIRDYQQEAIMLNSPTTADQLLIHHQINDELLDASDNKDAVEKNLRLCFGDENNYRNTF